MRLRRRRDVMRWDSRWCGAERGAVVRWCGSGGTGTIISCVTDIPGRRARHGAGLVGVCGRGCSVRGCGVARGGQCRTGWRISHGADLARGRGGVVGTVRGWSVCAVGVVRCVRSVLFGAELWGGTGRAMSHRLADLARCGSGAAAGQRGGHGAGLVGVCGRCCSVRSCGVARGGQSRTGWRISHGADLARQRGSGAARRRANSGGAGRRRVRSAGNGCRRRSGPRRTRRRRRSSWRTARPCGRRGRGPSPRWCPRR